MRQCRAFVYRARRWDRLNLKHLQRTLAASPIKTAINLLTAAPIALLAWPPFREWAVGIPLASAVFVGVLLLRLVENIWRAADRRATIKRAVQNLQISALPGLELLRAYENDYAAGHQPGEHTLKRLVQEMLESTVQVVRHGMQVHESVTVHANLMLPMEVQPETGPSPVPGLGIVAYNTQSPPSPSWTKVIIGDILAGTVYVQGKIEVVEDTEDPIWEGAFDEVRSKSFVCFPIGTPGSFMGVLNIDASERLVFRKKEVKDTLWPILAPQLTLLERMLAKSRVTLAPGN
jgi:hypothetical protein